MVRIKDGETVIIGGLIRNDSSGTVTKLPFLGDIPLLGALFRHNNATNTERELLIFITPHIVKDADIKLVQKKRFDIPQREQNTASGFNRESSIRESLDTYEGKNK
jgi:type II secretory pathway component GspD/PulD (secretin)